MMNKPEKQCIIITKKQEVKVFMMWQGNRTENNVYITWDEKENNVDITWENMNVLVKENNVDITWENKTVFVM